MQRAGRERHRVFVKSGVTAETTEELLHRHFSSYGTVTDVYIPRAFPSPAPKGFAYVSFETEDAVLQAVKEAVHDIDGKHFPVGRAEPRPAERNSWHHEDTKSMGGSDKVLPWPSRYSRALSPRGGLFPGSHGMARLGLGSPYALDRLPLEAARLEEIAPYASRAPFSFPEDYEMNGGVGNAAGFNLSKSTANSTRVFVGGLPDTLVERHIRAHFQRFGLVEDVYFPRERKTGRRRGFCFVRFDSARAAHTAAAQTSRVIMGHEVGEVKIANERPEEPGNDKSSEYGLDKSSTGPDGDFGAGLVNGPERGLGLESAFGLDGNFGPGGRVFLPDRSFGSERGLEAERGFGLDRGFWPDRGLGPDRGGVGQDRSFRPERLFAPDRGFVSDRDFTPDRGLVLEKSFGLDRSFGPDRSFGSERGHSLDRVLTEDISNGQDLYVLDRRYAPDRGYDRNIAPAFEREYSSDRTHGLESSTSNNKMGPPYSDLGRAIPREFALELAREMPNEFARDFHKDFQSDYSTNLRSEYPRDIPRTFDNRVSIRSELRFPVRYRPY